VDNKNLIRLPINGTFELTARCNLQCKMCLIRIDKKRMVELGGRELTAEEWIYMAQEAFDAGTIGLLLTGGEPMLRPDFIQIYKAIAQMGFMLTLYTNATLITPKIMEVLKEYPPHRIGITIYGASPETYEKVTGNAKAYIRMLEGVEQLRKLPSKLTIRTTIIQDNLNDLDKITEWAFKFGKDVEFNVSRIVTKPVRGGLADVDSCRLTPDQNVAMLGERSREFIINPFNKFMNENPEIVLKNEIPERSTEKRTTNSKREKQNTWREDQNINQDQSNQTELKPTLYGCEAGMNSYTITWNGKLIGCQMLGDCQTYPLEIGFQQAWEDFPKQVKLPPMPKQCRECEIKCNACPANRLAETGSLDGLPLYLCEESKLTSKMEDELIDEIQKTMKGKVKINYEKIRVAGNEI
jgi:MoaA/NifB/PqqE/SkfB family radical SAM enzyme